MFKNVISIFIIFPFFSFQAVGSSTPAFALKDLQLKTLSDVKTELIYKKEKIIFEKINEKQIKMNDQVIIIDSNETFEQLQGKLDAAYRKMNKRSALLDSLFVPKAHAISPLLSAIVGAVLGVTLSSGRCKSAGTGNGQGYVAPTPAYEPANVTY